MSIAASTYEEVVVAVREAWADVLGSDSADSVPLDVNFLEAGGNSLLLVMLWEQLQPLSTRPVKLSELFHHGTVAAQAELLTSAPEPAAPAPAQQSSGRSLLANRRAAAGGGA
ncbi:acyl carrier protein [Actinokineospora sp. NPDC004072]